MNFAEIQSSLPTKAAVTTEDIVAQFQGSALSPAAKRRDESPEASAKGDRSVKYVYLIQSISVPNQRYIGMTNDLEARLHTHNAGGSPHTSKYRPWKVVL